MNKVVLMGRLTKDPEVRYSQSETPLAVARYTLAVNRRFKREGEADADFINCVAFGKQGEFAEKFLKKGLMICISGRIQVRSYDDQTGQRRWITEIVVEEHDFAESKSSFETRMKNESMQPTANNNSLSNDDDISALMDDLDDDDLPF